LVIIWKIIPVVFQWQIDVNFISRTSVSFRYKLKMKTVNGFKLQQFLLINIWWAMALKKQHSTFHSLSVHSFICTFQQWSRNFLVLFCSFFFIRLLEVNYHPLSHTLSSSSNVNAQSMHLTVLFTTIWLATRQRQLKKFRQLTWMWHWKHLWSVFGYNH
jgi:hypothetical protein